MSTNVSDHQYDLDVKNQGQINLQSILWLAMRTYLPFLWMMFILNTLVANGV